MLKIILRFDLEFITSEFLSIKGKRKVTLSQTKGIIYVIIKIHSRAVFIDKTYISKALFYLKSVN
jgi:hypothetical protein